MTRQRHPLDFSPPRLSDLPLDDAKLALLARADRARESWLHSRQPRPLAERLINLLRGSTPFPRGAGANPQRTGADPSVRT